VRDPICSTSRSWCPGARSQTRWPRDGAHDRAAHPGARWRSYGADLRSTPAEALAEPFAAFPSRFLRIHDGCGSRPGRAELLTGTDGVSSPPRDRICKLPRSCGGQMRPGSRTHRRAGDQPR
jgi:hypothetical protein